MYVGGVWKRVKGALIAWELTNERDWPDKTDGFSTLSEGECILHRCNNPICVRPDHLYLGSKAENSQYAVKCGRWTQAKKGEEHYKAVLTWEQIREIRNLYSKEGFYRKATMSQRKLATKFGVSRRTIRAVLSHQTWKESYEQIVK
jgi:hypothetical protein